MLSEAVTAALPELRAEAEGRMTSTCTIREPGTLSQLDQNTGLMVEVPGAIVYSGKCRIKPASTWGRTAEAGEREVTPSTFTFSIPFDAPGSADVRRKHLVTVSTSRDSALINRVFEVRFTPDMGDDITARRLLCEEVPT